MLGKNGLKRTINDTDSILISVSLRNIPEAYEPEAWKHLMSQVQPGDIVVDIGAYIGLYTIALAKRIRPSGKVVAFEPDSKNFIVLKEHIELNGVSNLVDLIQAAVGTHDGLISFVHGDGINMGSHISHVTTNTTQRVQCVRLDTIFNDKHIDILKIDVEGYEEDVLKGAVNLFKDNRLCPRIIYIEVHPYAWETVGTTSESMISLLTACSYRPSQLNGKTVKKIDSYCHVVAYKENPNSGLHLFSA